MTISKASKINSNLKRQAKLLDINLNNAIKFKKTFKVREIGGTSLMIYDNGFKKSFLDYSIINSGSHLSGIIYKTVEKKVKENLYIPKNKDNNRNIFKTIYFDPDNINKYLYSPCYAIDINSCYWQTAFNLGIIDETLYNMGFKNKKGEDKSRLWKDARNAAIGSLGASIITKHYFEGDLIGKNVERRKFNTVRADIIDHVWDISNIITKKIKKGFCMFLTDCFFISEEYKDQIIKLLGNYNYNCKFELVYFKNIAYHSKNKNLLQVTWVKEKDVKTNITNEEYDKTHFFSIKRHLPEWKNKLK